MERQIVIISCGMNEDLHDYYTFKEQRHLLSLFSMNKFKNVIKHLLGFLFFSTQPSATKVLRMSSYSASMLDHHHPLPPTHQSFTQHVPKRNIRYNQFKWVFNILPKEVVGQRTSNVKSVFNHFSLYLPVLLLAIVNSYLPNHHHQLWTNIAATTTGNNSYLAGRQINPSLNRQSGCNSTHPLIHSSPIS